MRNFDFSPLYRSTIGFDRLADMIDRVNQAQAEHKQPSYPPYNVERLDADHYRIAMAVAGFSQDELEIQTENSVLTVRGTRAESDEKREFLHRGIAERNFELRFQLDDHVKVTGAELANGLLTVQLAREIPEAMKPRTIAINSDAGSQPRLVQDEAA